MRAGPDSNAGTPVDEGDPPLVSTTWLAQHLDDPRVRIADVRWYLPNAGKTGRAEYQRGHLPGAVFVDLDTQLAAPPGTGPGRHPIPDAQRFARAMSAAGVGADTHVVAYDDAGGAIAARLWWLLRHYGHSRVSVLDGGFTAWLAERRPVTTDEPSIRPAAFHAQPGGERVVDKTAVQRLAADPGAVVLDARAAERYEGVTEPVDPRPGHVPGALSAPFAGNLTPQATFLDRNALRRRYEALGVTPHKQVVAYCGSGVTACHTLLALHLAGFRHAALYEGSWSDWSSDPTLPAATGPRPHPLTTG
ncbi:MAG TPA: sulfurtransferase [Chloroflexota bacterium]|nr:sulfurtransferase [Chloroflexota bacterium]